MPLCFLFARYAVHSSTFRTLSQRLHQRPPTWHNRLYSPKRDYSSTVAERKPYVDEEDLERQQAQVGNAPWADDTKFAATKGQDEEYLDFLLGTSVSSLTGSHGNTPSRGGMKQLELTQKHEEDGQKEHNVFDEPSKEPLGKSEQQKRKRRRRLVGLRTWKLATSPQARALFRARLAAQRAGSPRQAFKFTSVDSRLRSSAVMDTCWNVDLAKLLRRTDPLLPEYQREERQILVFSPATFERVEVILEKLKEDKDAILPIEDLAKVAGLTPRQIWSETALWILCYDARLLLPFLNATNAPPYPPINWLEGCLEAYANYQFYGANISDEERSWRMQKLVKALLGLLDRESREQLVFYNSFFNLLLPYCTVAQAEELWAVIKLQKIRTTWKAMLHFAHFFGKNERIEKSLDALLEAKAAGVDVKSVAFLSGCATLLRKSSTHPDGLRVCLRLVEHLVSIGVQLNTRLFSILILNAVEAGDLSTAHALYHSMREQGFESNAYTCAIRLKACKMDIDNAALLGEVIQEAITYGDIRTDSVVSGEALHCLTRHHAKHNPRTAFATVATAYTQFYDPAPLERLGLRMPSAPPPPAGIETSGRLPSSTWTVGYMLWLYLECNASSSDAINLYNRWRAGVEAGDKDMVHWTIVPHIATMFVYRFIRTKKTLLQAAQVIKDMQRPLPASVGDGVKQAEPNVYTWSIFAHGFVRAGEHKLAEQVLGYMRAKGIEPNVVTWTTLISGYAQAQDTEGLVDAVRRMEQAGEAWNEWTHKGLGRYKNQARLRELLEQERFERSMDFTGEIKDEVEHKLADHSVEKDLLHEGEEADLFGSTVGQDEPHPDLGDGEGFADSPGDVAELEKLRGREN